MRWFQAAPLFVWISVALGIAALYAFVWPRAKVERADNGLTRFILRWFHSLVWALVALSLLIRASGVPLSTAISNVVALMALPIYAVFLYTLARP